MQTKKVAEMSNKELINSLIDSSVAISNYSTDETMEYPSPFGRSVEFRAEVVKEILRRMDK